MNKVKLTLIAAIAALGIALPTVALRRAPIRRATEASSVAAGYPSPYAN